jgi:hypothetical protein
VTGIVYGEYLDVTQNLLDIVARLNRDYAGPLGSNRSSPPHYDDESSSAVAEMHDIELTVKARHYTRVHLVCT